MTDKLFYSLWLDAIEQPDVDMYIGEYGYPNWFDDISTDADEVVKILKNIHHVAHISIRTLISESGLNQSSFARRFCIPLRTVQDWCGERRECPPYIKLMAAEILGVLQIPRN